MTDLFGSEEKSLAPETEFYIATVTARSDDGYQIQFAGESAATSKYYKSAAGATTPAALVGSRVVVMKQSGTYVILGKIDDPGTNYYFASSSYALSSSASTSAIVSRLNFLADVLVGRGLINIGS